MAINTAFFPNLMWNSRFASLAGDPFDNSAGFSFHSRKALLFPTCHNCSTPRRLFRRPNAVEVAGFVFPGDNFAIRAEVLNRLNAVDAYRKLFGEVFPEVQNGAAD